MTLDELLERSKPLLARSVSKNGDFFLACTELADLNDRLSAQQVVSLYEYIRDHSGRLESEWRAEFIAAFSEFRSQLPAQGEGFSG